MADRTDTHAARLWRERGIVTPEGVVLDFDRAGVTSRAIARVLDIIVLLVLLFSVGSALVAVVAALSPTAALVATLVLVFALVFVYPVVCETYWRGRTVGKAVLGLRVVTTEGASIRFRHAAVRSMLQLVDIVATVGGGAVISALSSPEGQRLGDMAAGTYVIRERRTQGEIDEREIKIRVPMNYEYLVPTIDPTALRPAQTALIRSFLVRSSGLESLARASIATQLAEKVSAVIGSPAPDGVHPETWLACVAAAIQQRSLSMLAPPAGAPARPGATP